MPFFVAHTRTAKVKANGAAIQVDICDEGFGTRRAAEEAARRHHPEEPWHIVEAKSRSEAASQIVDTSPPRSASEFLQELPGRTVFVGEVLDIEREWGVSYDVQNGGWNGEGPDTWLAEHVLRRFKGKRVRITIEELGDA